MAVSLVQLFACLGILLVPAAAESPGVLLASALGHPAHRAPPDHAALTERFHFLEVLHSPEPRVLPDEVEESWHMRQLRAAEQPLGPWSLTALVSATLSTLAPKLASTPSLPYELKRRFKDEDFRGQGSFGAAFKAVDKTTDQIVVVKVLVWGGLWLTPKMAHLHPDAMKWVNESIDECSKIREIRENVKVYPEGSPHVLMCLEDGIQATMTDSSKETDPLYIVMNFAGDEYGKWWNGVRWNHTAVEAASTLRNLTRDLMKGLRTLTHEDAKTKWIHHDLKPGNIVVSGDWNNSTLSLIDMGGAVPDSKPDEQEVCTPIFRPLDLAYPTRQRVGWKKPVHSFDMASAGLTILSTALASNPTSLAGLGPGAWPLWVSDTTARVLNEFISLKNMKAIADCVGKQNNEEPRAFVNRYHECFEKEGVNKQLGPALHQMVGQIGVGDSDSSRMGAFSPLAACGGGSEPSWAPDKPEISGYIVHEWVTTGFDKVLGRMLDLDPTKRPSPEEVLAEKWLATDYQPKSTGDTYTIPFAPCKEELLVYVARHMAFAIYLPLGIAAATGCCACGCCCFGCCCHMFAETPSAGFTAVVIGFAALSAAVASGVWLAQFTQIVLIISSLVLGPAIIVLGFNSLRRRGVEDSAKTGWTIGLFAAGAYFLMLFIAIFWLSRSTKHVLFYISDHWNAIQQVGKEEEIQSIVFMDQVMYSLLANLISITLAPAGIGLIAVGFGLWREDEHRRLNRQAPARRVTGTEMQSRQSAVAGP